MKISQFVMGQQVRVHDAFNRLDDHVGEQGEVVWVQNRFDPHWVSVELQESGHTHAYYPQELVEAL